MIQHSQQAFRLKEDGGFLKGEKKGYCRNIARSA